MTPTFSSCTYTCIYNKCSLRFRVYFRRVLFQDSRPSGPSQKRSPREILLVFVDGSISGRVRRVLCVTHICLSASVVVISIKIPVSSTDSPLPGPSSAPPITGYRRPSIGKKPSRRTTPPFRSALLHRTGIAYIFIYFFSSPGNDFGRAPNGYSI